MSTSLIACLICPPLSTSLIACFICPPLSTSLIACLICPPLSTSLIACLIIRYVPMYPNPAKLEHLADCVPHHQVRAHVS